MTVIRPRAFGLLIFTFSFVLFPSRVGAREPSPHIDFESQVMPILQTHCIRCHLPGNEKGEVSLASGHDLFENEYVVAGKPGESYLIDLVTSDAGDTPEMPKDAKPLSAREVAILSSWIASGADWPDSIIVREKPKADQSWWSLQPLDRAAKRWADDLASRGETSIDQNDDPVSETSAMIDRLVENRLAEEDLSRNAPADRRNLIRRVTYDLIGLPPTPDEVQSFLSDEAPNAYEKVIDRLLASPHYGERWARHWLDVVRFGESNGFERNVIINDLWPFRDYVIRSLNEDKSFDQFVLEHLAGDVVAPGQPDSEIGVAFLVAGPYDNVGNQDADQAAQIRANTIDEMIRSTGEAFLGLTIGCARCHDHKFDPILQSDYYGWYATFAAVRHGSRPMATPEQIKTRQGVAAPLEKRIGEKTAAKAEIQSAALARGKERLAAYQSDWTRPAIDRQGTEEKFEAVVATYVRLVSEGQDINPTNRNQFGIDEFEIWTAESPRNVALAREGAVATGPSRKIDDFPGAYGPHKAIDGKLGERFLASGGQLTIRLAKPETINRVVFSSAKNEPRPEHSKFAFVAEYRIEVSEDGANWTVVADSHDRSPANDAHRDHRLLQGELTPQDRQLMAESQRAIAAAKKKLAELPTVTTAWVGSRDAAAAKGPFHIFLGGSPKRPGEAVVPTSLATFQTPVATERDASTRPTYELDHVTDEATRRRTLAHWIVNPDNPLTPRVLANRIWHYHFGTGIVDTPSDFGYMGGRPTHPSLLDFLAATLIEGDWKWKPLHKSIVMSQTYRQASDYREKPAEVDRDARMLWRFPPRRLSAEEIRDTILCLAGKIDRIEPGTAEDSQLSHTVVPDGGPGFRLYRYLQDNVATYVPLDEHGPETYRRAIYHQNARASITDLMSDFDQPDCAFSTAKRAETTTPLQALTMLNHSFTLTMSGQLAARLRTESSGEVKTQIARAFAHCFAREPTADETGQCLKLVQDHGLEALCRTLLNTSELIYVR